MKKLFIVLTVASLGFVACNNESATETAKDTAAGIIDSTAGAMKDTLSAKMDTATKMIDSTAGAMKDTLKSKM